MTIITREEAMMKLGRGQVEGLYYADVYGVIRSSQNDFIPMYTVKGAKIKDLLSEDDKQKIVFFDAN